MKEIEQVEKREHKKIPISELKVEEKEILKTFEKYGIKYIEDLANNEIAENMYEDKNWEKIKFNLESLGFKIKEGKILLKDFEIPKKILLRLEEFGVKYIEDIVDINIKSLKTKGIGKSKIEELMNILEDYGIELDDETGEFSDVYFDDKKLNTNEEILPVSIDIKSVIEKIEQRQEEQNNNKYAVKTSTWKEQYKVGIEGEDEKESEKTDDVFPKETLYVKEESKGENEDEDLTH